MTTSPVPARSGLPVPDQAALEHSARAKRHICEQIEAAGGWISFAQYMDLALYAPGLGYYAAGSHKFGSSGDFVTAPEMTPLFGRTLARQIAQVLTPDCDGILELGAGSGALAVDIVAELDRLGCAPARYRILEPSAELAQRQRQRCERALTDAGTRFEWVESLPLRFAGVILANEVFDALPVHILVWRGNDVLERGVRLVDGEFSWEERPVSPALPVPGELRDLPAPYVSEICPAAAGLMTDLATSLKRGMVLLIDYGYPRSLYYHPERSGGTLMCHYRHHAHDEPFFLPGLQDITAHVDFTGIAEAAADAGLSVAGYTTQARFLLNCGITELLGETSPEDALAWLPEAAVMKKLLSPTGMGDLFKVMALTRGVDTPLLGFGEGDQTARL